MAGKPRGHKRRIDQRLARERRLDLRQRVGERLLDRTERRHPERSGHQHEAGELECPPGEAALVVPLLHPPGDAPPLDRPAAADRSCGGVDRLVDERVHEDAVLRFQARPMALGPHHPRDDHVAAPADLEIGAPQRRVGGLDAQPARRDIDDADVVPVRAVAHPGLHHHLATFFTSLHGSIPPEPPIPPEAASRWLRLVACPTPHA